MDARIPGAIGAVLILTAGGWLAVKGLEAAWGGNSRQAVAQIEPEYVEEAMAEEPAPSPPLKKSEPSSAASAAVAATLPRSSGIVGKGGTIYWVNGQQVSGSDGSSAQRYGSVTYAQQPGGRIERYETFGDTTYGPNGIVAQRSGNTTYVTGHDGRITTCTTVGATTNC